MTTVPEHISPIALYNMTDEQIETLLADIRARRLRSVQQYEAAQAAAKESAQDAARLALMKQCEMMVNNLDRVDKAIEALEQRIAKVRILRVELGIV